MEFVTYIHGYKIKPKYTQFDFFITKVGGKFKIYSAKHVQDIVNERPIIRKEYITKIVPMSIINTVKLWEVSSKDGFLKGEHTVIIDNQYMSYKVKHPSFEEFSGFESY